MASFVQRSRRTPPVPQLQDRAGVPTPCDFTWEVGLAWSQARVCAGTCRVAGRRVEGGLIACSTRVRGERARSESPRRAGGRAGRGIENGLSGASCPASRGQVSAGE